MIKIQTQQELDDKFNYPSFTRPIISNQWHTIYSFEFMRIIAISPWLSTINSMAHHHINSYPWFSINLDKNVFNKNKIPKDFDTVKVWEWKYDLSLQEFNKTINTDDLTLDDLFYLRLTREKSAAIDMIHRRIHHIRRNYTYDIYGQSQIYKYKEIEAQEILETDPEKLNPEKFIFINEYAELTGTDLISAAREVKLQAEFSRSRLCDTETVRIKYVRAINYAQDIPEIQGTIASFNQETIGHAST
jgi:hypothetical protein